MTVKDRIKQFIEYKKMSVRSFEKVCGLSFGYINNMRVSMQPDKVSSIATCFPELNTGWLLTGEGEMLKDNRINLSGTISLNDVVAEKKEEYTNYKEEVFRLRKECNEKANRIIELMEEVERLRKENTNLKIK